MIGSPEHPMLAFGLPADPASWVACLIGLVLLFWSPRARWLAHPLLVPLAMVGAAALSFGYFYSYLGGGPRIIDATTYLLEARSIADGSFSFGVPEPSGSFRGRFLVTSEGHSDVLAPIFPPGYPVVLAGAVILGGYSAAGPFLAAALVWLTHALTLQLTHQRRVAGAAALFSALCACLRYHTAETMSHGLAAALGCAAVLSSVTILQGDRRVRWCLSLGLSLGWLVATRQLTGMLFLVACLGPLTNLSRYSRPFGLRSWLVVGVALLPGAGLLLSHHWAITGDVLTSPQTRYYSLADGPLECFGLGWGKGCHYEHASVVAEQGGQGLTPWWSLKNTLHRLHWHSLDVAHFEPLLLVACFYLARKRKRPEFRSLLAAIVLLPLGYSLFYFNGSYPGGGARFFSELLPLWHTLLASALSALRVRRLGFALTLLGFSLHASFAHRALRSPHFGPLTSQVEEIASQIPKSDSPQLVFVSSAHLFNAGALRDKHIAFARRTRDDRQHLLAESLGLKEFLVWEDGVLRSEPVRSFEGGAPIVLEAEFEYPALAVRDLWAHPTHVSAACASQGRALKIERTGPHPFIDIDVGVPVPIASKVEAVFITNKGACQRILLEAPLSDPRHLRINLWKHPDASHIDRIILTRSHH